MKTGMPLFLLLVGLVAKHESKVLGIAFADSGFAVVAGPRTEGDSQTLIQRTLRIVFCAGLLLASQFLLLGSQFAHADVIYSFSGTITGVTDPSGKLAGTGITAGTSSFTGEFSYDPGALAYASSADTASYLGVSFQVTIDGSFDLADSPPVVTIGNDLSIGDVFFIGSHNAIDTFELPLLDVNEVFIDLIDSVGTLFGSTALPDSLAPADFDFLRFAIRAIDQNNSAGGYGIDGTIDTLTRVTVPAPGALGLLLAGLAALATLRMRTQSRRLVHQIPNPFTSR